ncbi:MAG: pyrroline-5-carboxylate reductase [Pseudomonadota bacterium]
MSENRSSASLANAGPVLLFGAGNMGGAMLRGWLALGLPPERVAIVDPAPAETIAALADRGVVFNPAPQAFRASVLLLAVKPQMFADVAPDLQGHLAAETVLVSVLAGTTMAQLETVYLEGQPILRVMPNTPAAIGQGMSVLYANGHVSAEQKREAEALMAAIGDTAWIDNEALMDAVTAVSGSGPAYVFHLAECLAAAGTKAGLPMDLADQLARQTVAGAGALIAATGTDPAELRRNVTSPNGTTAAALSVLMADNGLGRLLIEAVDAAKRRSEELAG